MNGITFIRKIDDLGRIVIPKELRGKLKLSENENILLKLTDNKIEIQKYSYINNYQALINGIINAFYEIYKIPIKLTDNNKTIIEVGNVNGTKEIIGENILFNSTIIGTLSIYSESENQQDTKKLCKLISKIIETSITSSWFSVNNMID